MLLKVILSKWGSPASILFIIMQSMTTFQIKYLRLKFIIPEFLISIGNTGFKWSRLWALIPSVYTSCGIIMKSKRGNLIMKTETKILRASLPWLKSMALKCFLDQDPTSAHNGTLEDFQPGCCQTRTSKFVQITSCFWMKLKFTLPP